MGEDVRDESVADAVFADISVRIPFIRDLTAPSSAWAAPVQGGHNPRRLGRSLRSWTSVVERMARSRFTGSSTGPAMTSAMTGPSMLFGRAETLTAARAAMATIRL